MAPAPALDIIHADSLAAVPHGFFGSGGGTHQFGFGGPGDPASVASLRVAAAQAVSSGAKLAAPHQIHSPDVITVDQLWKDGPEGRPQADALVTNRSDVVLGIVTADCAPVLLANSSGSVVGAAHAGWRGAQGGVLENTLAAMNALGAASAEISAAIGPTIAQASYEVDAPFREHFEEDDDRFFSEGRPGHWQFDLPGYIAARLARAGVPEITLLDMDTFSSDERFHSYRRSQLEGKATYGRQISMISVSV